MATPFEGGGQHGFALLNGVQQRCRLPDVPGSSGDLEQRLQHGPLGPRLQRHLHGFGGEQLGDRGLLIDLLRPVRLLDERQLAICVLAHLLFEPVSDLRGMKLPVAANSPARNAAALHQLFNLPPIPPELLRELVETVPLV